MDVKTALVNKLYELGKVWQEINDLVFEIEANATPETYDQFASVFLECCPFDVDTMVDFMDIGYRGIADWSHKLKLLSLNINEQNKMDPIVNKILEGADILSTLSESSALNKKYTGIWYGAKTNPITVKELLDKVIDCDGRGFNIKVDRQFEGGKNVDIDYYLTDEEGRGKFKLSPETIDYLKSNLKNSWMLNKLS